MEGDASSYQSLLLVPERDEHKELWHGPRAGVDGALALTGLKFICNLRYYKGKLCV